MVEQLPPIGDWDGPIFGEIGALLDEGDRVQCHCCGRFYKALHMHVRSAHNLSADDYRAVFGLKYGRQLCSTATRELQRLKNGERISQYGALGARVLRERMATLSPEELAFDCAKAMQRPEGRRIQHDTHRRVFDSWIRSPQAQEHNRKIARAKIGSRYLGQLTTEELTAITGVLEAQPALSAPVRSALDKAHRALEQRRQEREKVA